MRTSIVNSTYFTSLKPVYINSQTKVNKQRPYLYNEVFDIIKKYKAPAIFHNQKIELPAPTEELLVELRKLGISYRKLK